MKPSFRRIALIGKPNTSEIEGSLREMQRFLEQRGCEVLALHEQVGMHHVRRRGPCVRRDE